MADPAMIKVHNLSSWPDALIKKAVKLALPTGLRTATLFITDTWFNFEHHLYHNEIVDQNEAVEWDGLAFTDEATAYSHLSQNAVFPLVWWVNTEFRSSYQRGMVLFSPMEFFVYNFAHELRHLWQRHNGEEPWLGEGFNKFDCEMDADLYAIIRLNEYRRKTAFTDYHNRP
jgi:hypothetical protein